MRCPRCQGQSPDGAAFCEACGAAVAATCPACRAATGPGARFCSACGAPLGAGAAGLSLPPRAYTPAHLAERILASRERLEGERKQVTVLFADVKGSTELLAELDPEESRRLLDGIVRRMLDAVHFYEGTVNHVMGDGVMALFGAPLAQEDHAVRACYAALRMQESMRQHAERVREAGGPPIEIRVGLNSGEVVVGSVEGDLHVDYTAVGPTTHLAARMEQMAAPGSIWITAHTLRLAEGYVDVEPLGPHPVKGLRSPVDVYRLRGPGPAQTRLQAAALRGLTPFVGREAEMAALRQALEGARTGRGTVVGVAGEPGVGKSRLFQEFLASPDAEGWRVLHSSLEPHSAGRSYSSVIELLRGYFQLHPADEPATVRARVTQTLRSLDADLEPALVPLLALLDPALDDPAWTNLDPPQRRQSTLDGCLRLLLRVSQERPLVLAVENLHWIDPETQATLDRLVDSLRASPILLLVNYRPEYRAPWVGRPGYDQLRLEPLSPGPAEQLLVSLLGADMALRPLAQLLIERTQGNPFFLEESVRALVETGVLVGGRGDHRLSSQPPEVHVPASVHAVVAGRIDRLDVQDKSLLQSASVIGREIPFALVHAVVGEPEDALRAGLTRLQAAGFLYEARLFPDLAYAFRHALIHEVAYGSLLRERRRVLHARIVDAMESLYPEPQTRHVDALAHHALRGELWDKAVAYLRQTGLRAMERSANREAVTCFEQALVALAHLPESPEHRALAIDVRFALRSSLQPLGELERAAEHLRAAESLAEAAGDRIRLGRALAYQANHSWWMGDHRRAVELGRRALDLALGVGDIPIQVLATFFLGQAYNSLGDYRAAADFTGRNVKLLVGDLAHQRFGMSGLPSALSRAHLARALAELGEFEEAATRADEAVRTAQSVRHAYDLIVAYVAENDVWLRRGHIDRAIPAVERALALCRSAHLPVWFPTIATNLGLGYALAGRVAEALPLLEQAVAQALAMRIMYNHALRLTWLGEGYLAAGRLDDAAAAAQQALDLARERHERGHQAWSLRLLGEIAARREPPAVDAATAHYEAARALAEELGMRPLAARCCLGLGLLQPPAPRSVARGELAEAVKLLRSMDMSRWLAQAEAALEDSRPGGPLRSGASSRP